MVKPFPSKTHIGNHMLHPETLMLNYGYDPHCRKEPSNHRSS
jgi:methionine-gamma-lyase